MVSHHSPLGTHGMFQCVARGSLADGKELLLRDTKRHGAEWL